MGKSFRNWISEKLLLNNKDIKLLIEDVMDNNREIKSFWKDEIFTSILLSDYSDVFFENFGRELLEGDYILLEQLASLLRLACKEADSNFYKQYRKTNVEQLDVSYFFTQPKGNGWKSFITFIYDNIEAIKLQKINIILPLLHDWNSKFKEGEITRKVSLIALKYYDWIHEGGYYRHNENIKKIVNVIINGSSEIIARLPLLLNFQI
jgi:hypothetical protein